MAMAPRRKITTRKDPPWPDDDSEEDSDYLDDRQPDVTDEEASIISGDHSVIAEGRVRKAEAAAAKAAKETAATAAEEASDDDEDTDGKAHDEANDEEPSDDEPAADEDTFDSGGERCAYSFITHKYSH
jgi:hypothetical protein